MSKHIVRAATALIAVGISSAAFGAAFTGGDLVVTQVGTGTGALSSAATASFLDEFDTSGNAVQSIALPTAVSGANKPLTLSGTATSEGFIALSANGQYLTVGGYPAVPGTAGVTTSTTGRVAGLIDMSGNIDTTTVLGDAASIGNIRSVVSADGTQFWAGSSAAGIRYTTYGSTGASTQLNTSAPTNTRVVNIYSGQLYVSSASGTFQGVGKVGTGEPTTSGQSLALLPGFPTATGPSSYDYVFADPNTLYVADDRATTGGGGLQKWSLSGGTWSLDYTLTAGLTAGLRGLTGMADGAGNENLYATSADTLSKLVSISDDLSAQTAGDASGESFSVLATAGTNTAFRGVELIPAVPEPMSLSLLAIAAPAFCRRRRA